MKRLFCLFTFLLLCSAAAAAEPTVVKRVLASPGPNLFYENPSLATNERTGITLAVWEKHPGNHPDHDTLLRKISAAGNLKGSTKNLIQGTNTYSPAIVYNSVENEFLVAYADEFRNPLHTIFVQRLDSTGRKKGAPVQVSTDTGSSFVNQHTFAAYDAATNLYFVVWTRNSTQASSALPGEGIHVAALDANLAIVAGPTLIAPETTTPLIENPQVRALTVNRSGRVLVAYTETVAINPIKSNYFIASVDTGLGNLSTFKVNKTPVSPPTLNAVFAELPTSDFLYFIHSGGKIRKRKLDTDGKPIGSITTAFSGPLKSNSLFVPRFVSTGVNSAAGLLVAVEDPSQSNGDGAIWIQTIDSSGKPIGTPSTVDSAFISAPDLQIVLLPSSTAQQLKFSLVYVNGSQLTIPPQGEFSELIHLKITLPAQ